jgi:hypothetical protein
MKSNTPKVLSSGSLDKSQGMQAYLKEQKIINELCKGVQGMKHYLYPSQL